jgi:hypothetical protein
MLHISIWLVARHARERVALSGGRPGETSATKLTIQVAIGGFFNVCMTVASFTCVELFPGLFWWGLCGVARRCCGGVGINRGRLCHSSKITVLVKVSSRLTMIQQFSI